MTGRPFWPSERIPRKDVSIDYYTIWALHGVSVRLIHNPTGVIVMVKEQDSQLKALRLAVQMLEAQLTELGVLK